MLITRERSAPFLYVRFSPSFSPLTACVYDRHKVPGGRRRDSPPRSKERLAARLMREPKDPGALQPSRFFINVFLPRGFPRSRVPNEFPAPRLPGGQLRSAVGYELLYNRTRITRARLRGCNYQRRESIGRKRKK